MFIEWEEQTSSGVSCGRPEIGCGGDAVEGQRGSVTTGLKVGGKRWEKRSVENGFPICAK